MNFNAFGRGLSDQGSLSYNFLSTFSNLILEIREFDWSMTELCSIIFADFEYEIGEHTPMVL